MKIEKVKDWMSSNPYTVTPDTLLPEVHRLFNKHHIRRLPVIEEQKLVGIVTLGDVREAEPSTANSLTLWELNYLLAKLPVKEVMTSQTITIQADATIGEAAHLMLIHKIGGIPVLDESNNLVGMITESDIFRMVAEQWQTQLSK